MNAIGNFNNWVPDLINWGRKVIPPPPKKIKPVKIKLAPKRRCYSVAEWNPWNRVPVNDNSPPKSPLKCPFAFIRWLEKKGFRKLGAGMYSTVLYKSGDRVLKVQRNLHRDAWLDYIIWASRKGYAGGLAPKVYSYKVIGDFAVAVMEKIEYVASSISPEDDNNCRCDMFTRSVWYKNKLHEQLLDQIVPGAVAFKNALRDEFKHGSLDLHNGNIMFRADGSMVVVDPVSHPSTLKVVRLRAKDFGFAQAA